MAPVRAYQSNLPKCGSPVTRVDFFCCAQSLAVASRNTPALLLDRVQQDGRIAVQQQTAFAIPYCGPAMPISADVGSWGDLEHDAATVGPIILGCPIHVPLLVEDESCLGRYPIRAVVLRTEAVQDCLLAFWRELENDTASRWAAGGAAVGTAVVSRSIEVSLLVEDHPCWGPIPVDALLLRTEAVEDCLLAFRRELEYDTATSGVADAVPPVPPGVEQDCEVALWIKEGWQWILNQALGIQAEKPDWLNVPVMRRIAITTPNVMAALRRLNRDKARPYNFALSPVLVNLSNTAITLLGPFEKDSSLWGEMSYINIHDGTTYTLNSLPPLMLAQTFEMIFFQFHRHPECKSLASDGTSCKADTAGLLKRYPVTATSFQPIGKETEHGWEQAEDISTLMPSLVRYREKIAIPGSKFQARLQQSSLAVLQGKTGLSRHTILRARRGQKVRAKSLKLLRTATRMAQCIMKERPAKRRRAPPPLRYAAQGFAPLRRRLRVTAMANRV